MIDKNAVIEFRYRELYKKKVVMDIRLRKNDDPDLWGRAMDVIFRVAQLNTWKNFYARPKGNNSVKWAFVLLLGGGEKYTYIGIGDYPQHWDSFWVLMDMLQHTQAPDAAPTPV